MPVALDFDNNNHHIRNLQLVSVHLKKLLSLGGSSIYMTCHNDGWVRDKDGNLLFWVPDYLRSILCDFDTIAILGQTSICRLSLSHFCHGSDWINCVTTDTRY
ncbi:hypothetical protein BDQ17DRAFT_1377300 [Cyathus striatus]|nr:hypothetical protein BDQ17DRAFT_1377300 [Cyathus striatus]